MRNNQNIQYQGVPQGNKFINKIQRGESDYNNQKILTNQINQSYIQQIELQNINIDKGVSEQHEDREEREEDLRALIELIQGNIQVKRMERSQMVNVQKMDQYYDLLPFNVRGFKLINRASLLEANFIDKYILKQTQDLNLDLHKGQFENHIFVKAAIAIVKNVPCWSFFMTLLLFILFLLQMILDPLILDIITQNQDSLNAQLDDLRGRAHTSRDDQIQTELEDETLAISFLIPLISIRLVLWFLDLILRFIALQYFRKKYLLWVLILDFLILCLTVMIGGFSTSLSRSIAPGNQSTVELAVRNFIYFVIFIFAMVQARKALVVIKRLSLLYYQQEPSCFNFEEY